MVAAHNICKRPAHVAPAALTLPAAYALVHAARTVQTDHSTAGAHLAPLRSAPIVHAAPQASEESTNKFDVVVFPDPRPPSKDGVSDARLFIRNITSGFQSPDEGRNKWSEETREEWEGMKEEWGGMKEFDAILRERNSLPVVAMNGETPCAVGLGRTDYRNTFVLSDFIRNAGDDCKGAGAAVLCYLIRNSKDKKGEFSPPKLVPSEDEPDLKRYYESFGCTEPSDSKNVLKMMRSAYNDWKPLVCNDPNPQKCEPYDGEVFDADSYFGDKIVRMPRSPSAEVSSSKPKLPDGLANFLRR